MGMSSLLRLDALARRFVSMCASLFPFRKRGGLLFLCCEKIHSMLHCAMEIMRWGSLINCSGEAAETAHKINVKGPGANVNQRDSALGTLMTHARRKETARIMGEAIQGNNINKHTITSNNRILFSVPLCSAGGRWRSGIRTRRLAAPDP